MFYSECKKICVILCFTDIITTSHPQWHDSVGGPGESPSSNELEHKISGYDFTPWHVYMWHLYMGHGTAVAPCNWTPWRLRHHWAAPQRFHSQENIQQSAQMRHSSKHFCCQIFTSLKFTLSLTSILWQSVWIKSCEIGQGVFFIQISWHLNRNLWQMYHFLSSTNPSTLHWPRVKQTGHQPHTWSAEISSVRKVTLALIILAQNLWEL